MFILYMSLNIHFSGQLFSMLIMFFCIMFKMPATILRFYVEPVKMKGFSVL